MSRDNDARSSLFGALFFPAIIVGVLIIVAILVMSFSGHRRAVQNDSNVRQLSDQTLAKFRNSWDALGMSMGSPDAPVTIREFGDYQCPACGHFEPTAERIRDNFVKTGRARFIFFDFPLPMHANAHEAAIAARCAARQHKFWPYHHALYKNQLDWAEQDNPMSNFLDMAVESGVDSQQLKQCIKDKAPEKTIAAEMDAGKAIRLQATPTIIIGKTMFSGGPRYEKIQQIMDRLAPSQKNDKSGGKDAAGDQG